ncbi:MAG: transketolase C-terminal domain-containing protein [Thermodesulfobacteriota bacterium]|nr:transketolase C-terminal domain-containing protein [Thermodesulfobacteriota bacterium]
MAERILCEGNIAAARGALAAGCKYFFGYPITPQSEIGEFLSAELPKIGGVFVQSESESGSIYMLYGGAMSGERVMTSTSGCGFALMAEGISYISAAQLPCVLIDVMRMGPGIGTGGQQGQTDYNFAVKAPGIGGHHCIVLAPYSCQEVFDFTQLAFHLADKYLILVIVLTDFIIGRMAENIELKTLDFGPIETEKFWVLKGKDKKGGKAIVPQTGSRHPTDPSKGVPGYHVFMREKYQRIADAETRYDTYMSEDATMLIVAYGSSARAASKTVDMARAEGVKLGLFRPITLWPFPRKALKEAALKVGKVLVVEDSIGELVDDVDLALQGQVPMHFLGVWGRHDVGGSGIIHPERILEEVKTLI